MVGRIIALVLLGAVFAVGGCNYTAYSVGYHDTHTSVRVERGYYSPPPVYERHHHHYGGPHAHPYYYH